MENRRNLALGELDLFRGVGIIAITLGHTLVYFSYDSFSPIFLFVGGMFLYSVINAFFIASGFSFRPTKVKKCIKNQVNIVLKGYWISAIVIVTLFPIVRYYLSGSKRHALFANLSYVIPLALGLNEHRGREYKVWFIEVLDSGTLWFVVALAMATITLNIVLQIKSEKLQKIVLIVLALIGFELTKHGISLPYCIERGFFYALTLYVGYRIKKEKLLFVKLPIWQYLVMLVLWVFGMLWENLFDLPQWLRFFDFWNIIGYLAAGFLLIKASLFVQDKVIDAHPKDPVIKGIRVIGKNSFWLYCIHAIEGVVIPWYILSEKFSDQPVLGFIIFIILRWLAIGCGFLVFKKISCLRCLVSTVKKQ